MFALLLLVLAYIGYKIYTQAYFSGAEFKVIRRKVKSYADECNALNTHLRSFISRESKIRTIDTGSAQLIDKSNFNYQRDHWVRSTNSQLVHECSASVCKSAKNEPFKYLCKYFNISPTESNLEEFEEMLNNFAAADQGKVLLTRQKQTRIDAVTSSIPALIKIFSSKRVESELGFEPVEKIYYQVSSYTFQYISAGGKSSISTDIRLDLENLERFIQYLAERVNFIKSNAGQRSLMTKLLREKIKQRDNYTCQNCSNSIQKEPNLLLEIDHILPISKGGITSENNLQALCWKCNRSKGAKIIPDALKEPGRQGSDTSESPEDMYDRAKSLYSTGKPYEAIKVLMDIVECYPKSNAAEVAQKLLNAQR